MTPFQFEKLRRIGFAPSLVNQLGALAAPAEGGPVPLRVVETQRDTFTLHDGDTEQPARAALRLVQALQQREDALTIGDWVLATPLGDGSLLIVERLDPVTQIARRANDGRRQPLASNVDTALLTMGLDDDFNPRRMERYIAMVRACGVVPVVVLTKADLAPDAAARVAQLCQRLPATVPVLAVNALNGGQTRAELAPWLAPAHTLVLLGASGAGKSTLTNALTGQARQDTGSVRASDGRGQHTTTARSLQRCPQGACIIDTPGLRTWRPDADARTLAATFEDVQGLAAHCHFRDCHHDSEPGCAVRGQVGEDRLRNYRKLLRDAQRAEQTPLDRIALRRKWKRLGKAGTERAREKRG